MAKDRGFRELVGKTIVSANTRAINEVVLTDSEGNTYAIDAEEHHLGIPVISLEKGKANG